MEENLELRNHIKIGIMGCGHLGQAIAQSLISHGLEKKDLLISIRGNPKTHQRLEELDMTACIASNQRLFQESEIVFITVKPQDILELRDTFEPGKALVVSCMAGVSIELLSGILGMDVYRMMFSGPDTIASGKGVAAMYPEHEKLKSLLSAMNVALVQTYTENDLNIFTAGVCLPAALLTAENPAGHKRATDRIGKEYPLLLELFAWADKVLPHFDNNADKEAYVGRMITKGGVTDAIVKSMKSGAPLNDALKKGIERTGEITMELKRFYGGVHMEELKNVTVLKKANIYFDGNVTSRTVFMEDGKRKTLGIILPGQYEFGTEDMEHMEVLAGKIDVLLPGSEAWASFGAGQTFDIPANCRFQVSADAVSDYCCSYIKE